MKILWLSHLVPYPPKAGVLLRAHHLVKELSKHHEVHLLAFNQRGLMEPYFNSYEEGTKIAADQLNEICTRVKFFDCPTDRSPHGKKFCALKSLISKRPYNINWLQDNDYAKAVKEWHQQEQYDLIHCDTISLAPYLEGIKGCLTSLDHHNIESHMLIRRSQIETNVLKKFYFWQEGHRLEQYEKNMCPTFSTNLVCSTLDGERLTSICDNCNYTEISNGVDVDFFIPGKSSPDSNSLIFIGTLDWYPNTQAVRFIANEVWPLLKQKIPDVSINIIGSRPPDDIVKLGQSDPNFNVLGFVDDIHPYLERATAYICPIYDGGGTKLKMLDAFSSGKAVITHPVACEGLGITDNVHVLLASSAEEYVDKTLSIFNDQSLRKTLENNARTHAVNHFSFSAIGEKLAKHFSEL